MQQARSRRSQQGRAGGPGGSQARQAQRPERCSRTCTGLAPAATIFMPSAIIAADRMVAVVVPSPARSLVRAAACGRQVRGKDSAAAGEAGGGCRH